MYIKFLWKDEVGHRENPVKESIFQFQNHIRSIVAFYAGL